MRQIQLWTYNLFLFSSFQQVTFIVLHPPQFWCLMLFIPYLPIWYHLYNTVLSVFGPCFLLLLTVITLFIGFTHPCFLLCKRSTPLWFLFKLFASLWFMQNLANPNSSLQSLAPWFYLFVSVQSVLCFLILISVCVVVY